jgi:hypothetical protein
MNAAMRKYVPTEEADMPADERNNLEIQVAELRADVRHIQADTTEIKTDLRATNQRIHELSDSLASAKIWALWLYVTLAGSMFYVMARGFKWI